MNIDRLIVPVYINEKIVLDMLAILEDGFSTVSQLSYTEHRENSTKQNAEAKVSTATTILSKLRLVQLNSNNINVSYHIRGVHILMKQGLSNATAPVIRLTDCYII